MNCPTIDDLSKYTEQLLREEEHALIQNHVHSCEGCMRVVDAFMEEKRFIKETLKTPVLPNEFAHLVLDQLEPYKQPTQKRRKVRKPVMLSAAAAILALGMSAAFNPGFAEWIGGFFSTGEVDEGLRLADEAGYTEQVNVEATDNGITLKWRRCWRIPHGLPYPIKFLKAASLRIRKLKSLIRKTSFWRLIRTEGKLPKWAPDGGKGVTTG